MIEFLRNLPLWVVICVNLIALAIFFLPNILKKKGDK